MAVHLFSNRPLHLHSPEIDLRMDDVSTDIGEGDDREASSGVRFAWRNLMLYRCTST